MGKLCARAFVALIVCFVGCAVGTNAADEANPHGPVDAAIDMGTVPRDAGDPVDAQRVIDAGNDSAGGDDGGSDSGADASISCASPDTCMAATMLGSGTISGDTTSPSLSGTGDTAEWFQFNATENDSGPLGVPMKLHVVLTSPPGENFDLYVYVFEGGMPGQLDCTQVAGMSTNPAGQDDVVDLIWGETGTFANGVDDSRLVTVEVRAASNNCMSGSSWSLSVKGH